MKLIKLFSLGVMLCSGVHAATVTVSAGFGATNGLLVTTDGAAAAGQFIAIGSWNSVTSTFTQFATGIQDTGTVNGAFTDVAPAAVNSQVIHLYVSTGTTLNFAPSANWVLYKTAANTAFPSDVSSTLASATATFSNFTTATKVAGSTSSREVGGATINFVTVPEPSAALLGAIGALGLLRRRRN